MNILNLKGQNNLWVQVLYVDLSFHVSSKTFRTAFIFIHTFLIKLNIHFVLFHTFRPILAFILSYLIQETEDRIVQSHIGGCQNSVQSF